MDWKDEKEEAEVMDEGGKYVEFFLRTILLLIDKCESLEELRESILRIMGEEKK